MSIDIHVSDSIGENVFVDVEICKEKSVSKWQRFKKNHPKLATALCWSGLIAGGSLIAYGVLKGGRKLAKTPPMGRDNPRAHVRKDGKEKVGYDNKERANAQAMWDNFIHGTDMTAYECPICGKFHVGHDHAAKSA